MYHLFVGGVEGDRSLSYVTPYDNIFFPTYLDFYAPVVDIGKLALSPV